MHKRTVKLNSLRLKIFFMIPMIVRVNSNFKKKTITANLAGLKIFSFTHRALILPVPGCFEFLKAQGGRFCPPPLRKKSIYAIDLKISGNVYDHKVPIFAKF